MTEIENIIENIEKIEGIEKAVVMNYDRTVPFLDLHISLKEVEE